LIIFWFLGQPGGRSNGMACADSQNFYIFGGTPTPEVWMFNFARKIWTVLFTSSSATKYYLVFYLSLFTVSVFIQKLEGRLRQRHQAHALEEACL
jgi:hypothetical protein